MLLTDQEKIMLVFYYYINEMHQDNIRFMMRKAKHKIWNGGNGMKTFYDTQKSLLNKQLLKKETPSASFVFVTPIGRLVVEQQLTHLVICVQKMLEPQDEFSIL